MKIFSIFIVLLLIASCNKRNKPTENIAGEADSQEKIAIDFMENIYKEKYNKSYEVMSNNYQYNVNLEDFIFRMRILKSLAGNEKFRLFNETAIGVDASAEMKRLDGKSVSKEDLMTEFNFTIESEFMNKHKEKFIYLRFESGTSKSIEIVNFSIRTKFTKVANISSLGINPFFTGKYILLCIDEDNISIDIRGRSLRYQFLEKISGNLDSTFNSIQLEELINLLQKFNTDSFSAITVTNNAESENYKKVIEVLENDGFSRFNIRNKDLSQLFNKNLEKFKSGYSTSEYDILMEE